MSDLNTKFRQLRDFHGYSQEAVAYYLRITQSTYSDVENGKTRVSIERLTQIAVFYGVSISDLLNKTSTELLNQLSNNQLVEKIMGVKR